MSEPQSLTKKVGQKNGDRLRPATSPLNGASLPTVGRPKGVRNRLTAARDAILASFEQVGGVDYLNRLANGTQSDRQAYISLLKHILPSYTHIAADLQGGGLQVQLNWLQVRQIGTPMAQPHIEHAQVIDAIEVSAPEQRITDAASSAPAIEPEPARPAAQPAGAAEADPPSPRRAGGGGVA